MPVMTALPGPSIHRQLHDERAYSERLALVLEQIAEDRKRYRRENIALREHLRLSDAIAESLRVELEALRDYCVQRGLNPELLLED